VRRTLFNRLSLEVPSGWQDNSLITLAGPKPERPKTMHVRQTEVERPNLVVRRLLSTTEAIDLEAFATTQEELMRGMGLDLRPLSRDRMTLGSISAWVCDYALHTPGGVLRQLNVYFQAGGELYVACGTCSLDDSSADLRETFLGIARSLRVEASPD
jgi:hypothetical protein